MIDLVIAAEDQVDEIQIVEGDAGLTLLAASQPEIVITDSMNQVTISDAGTKEIELAPPEANIEVVDRIEKQVEILGSGGIQGAPGAGVAPGGAIGDVLVKHSDDPYDTVWSALGTLGGDKSFSQSFALSSTVTVTHNLGKRPAVTVIDSANDQVEGEVEHVSLNELTVSFSAPFSGIVLCN